MDSERRVHERIELEDLTQVQIQWGESSAEGYIFDLCEGGAKIKWYQLDKPCPIPVGQSGQYSIATPWGTVALAAVTRWASSPPDACWGILFDSPRNQPDDPIFKLIQQNLPAKG